MSPFITFEGGEGSGKSVQARALYRKLCRLSIPVLRIHEPGSTPLGEKLSKLLKHGDNITISPLGELFLFNASRAQLVSEIIRPALEAGKVVVCDRFDDSTVAYQGYGRGLNIEQILTLNRIATGGLIPDLTVLIDIPVIEGLARKRHAAADRFEREEIAFHERVRKGYLSLAKAEPRRFMVIDGRRDRKTIAGLIWSGVSSLLENGQ